VDPQPGHVTRTDRIEPGNLIVRGRQDKQPPIVALLKFGAVVP